MTSASHRRSPRIASSDTTGGCRAGRRAARPAAFPALDRRAGGPSRPPAHVRVRAILGRSAVRRFIAKIGEPALDELFELRRGRQRRQRATADAGGLEELRARVAGQLAADVVLDRRGLAVDGDDLIAELGATPGPRLGAVLERLLEAVVEDPSLNDRPTLLLMAQAQLAGDAP